MRRVGAGVLCVGLLAGAISSPAHAGRKKSAEDADLEMIPTDVLDLQTPQSATGEDEALKKRWETSGVFIMEFQRSARFRTDLRIPLPTAFEPDDSRHQIRNSLNYRLTGRVGGRATLTLQNRFNWLWKEYEDPTSAQVQNDLKELYLTFKLNKTQFLDLGRVNIKEGVATGFNPTDYFKTGAVATRTSEDPGKLREDRLGALMARWQYVGEKGSLAAAYAPRVRNRADRWFAGGGDFSLSLNSTNANARFHLKLAPLWWKDDNPEFIYYQEAGQRRVGLNWAKGLGDKHVVYGEWSLRRGGGPLEAMGADAPAGFPATHDKPRPQMALGVSYADSRRRSLWVEYHRNQTGFSPRDWRRWMDDGVTAAALAQNPATADVAQTWLTQLWGVRKFSQDLGEPMSRDMMFVRYSATDAYRLRQDVSAIGTLNLHDGSFFVQGNMDWRRTNSRTITFTASYATGKSRSEFGVVPVIGGWKLEKKWFF